MQTCFEKTKIKEAYCCFTTIKTCLQKPKQNKLYMCADCGFSVRAQVGLEIVAVDNNSFSKQAIVFN